MRCVECGVEYQPRQATQQYCGSRCKSRAKYKRKTKLRAELQPRPCEECKEEFVPLRLGRPARYCSRKCGQRAKDKRYADNGANRLRMQRRRAAKLGVSLEEYLASRVLRVPRVESFPQCRIWFKICAECAVPFVARTSHSKVCSDECRARRGSRQTSASIMRRYHSDPEFRDYVIARSHARRADKLGLGNRRITVAYLGERDGWRCGICRKRITDRKQASIDHIVPLSLGGLHELSNVHISHRRCNQSKHIRAMNEQLLLVG